MSSVRIRFNSSVVTGLVLAKVGNPQREEPLQTSKEVFRVDPADRETLTGLFLKPFRNLIAHRFRHHTSLDKHEMNVLVTELFAAPGSLLDKGCDIARRLYSKSNHPNIKSGDLCISLVDDVEIEGRVTSALCILKAESVVPFLSISTEDGDLRLRTDHGINPDKIDKGCLIVNHWPEKGYYVLTFDRSGGESRFWVKEFLGLQAVPDSSFLTNTFAEMAVAAVQQEMDQSAPPEESCRAARQIMEYFDDHEHFDLQEFEEQVLKTPDAVARFAEQRSKVEEEQGEPLATNFEIAPKEVKKTAKKHTGAVIKLDTGFEVHVKPVFSTSDDPLLERGFDEARGMHFIRLFFNEDISGT